MGIFNFFKKRVKKNITKIVETQSENHNKQKNETHKIRFSQKIQASTPKYKTAEAVIAVLQNNGFVLRYINTYGEGSVHDGTDSFRNKYHSVEEFTSKVYDDFNDHKERIAGAAQLTWSCTFFELYHENLNFEAVISLGEDDGKEEPREAYLTINKENVDMEDEEYLAKLLLMLHPFLVPKMN